MGKDTMTAAEYQQLARAGKVNNRGRIIGDFPAPKVSGPTGGDRQPEGPMRNKYGAKPVKDPDGGQPFPSTLEFNNATDLRNMVRAGEIVSVGRQVLVLLEGGVTWQIDFIVHHNDGSVEYIESKGKDTADFLIKEKLFRAKYPGYKLSIQRKRSRKTRTAG